MTPRDLALSQLRLSGKSDDELNAILDQWELIPFHQGEDLQGFALVRGTEFHCHLVPGCKLNRKAMRAFLAPIFEKRGYLTTRVEQTDLANQRFNKVFGFHRTWSDDRFHYYVMNELPFGEKLCQQ